MLFVLSILNFFFKRNIGSVGKNVKISPWPNFCGQQQLQIGNNVNFGAFIRINIVTHKKNNNLNNRNNFKKIFKIVIKDGTSIGSGSFISANNYIEIGKNCIFSTDVFVTDHDHLFLKNKSLSGCEVTYGKETIIGDNVFVGTKVSILKGVKIGQNSVIGANSVVTKNVPENSIFAGNPAIFIKKLE
jgi:acetyltransferase-like isoleucine patch superfamily enzyme